MKRGDMAIPDFESGEGLLPAIAQDAESGKVLMLAWMNRESFNETMRTSRAVYYSRSRKRLWRKGEESGHSQEVVAIHVDCDADAILLKVRQIGAACHEGYATCFYRQFEDGEWKVIEPRMVDPETVYQDRKH